MSDKRASASSTRIRTRAKIVGGAVLAGIAFWLLDSLTVYVIHRHTVLRFGLTPSETFLDSLILNIPPHSLIIRAIVLSTLLISSIIIVRILAHKSSTEQNLAKRVEQLSLISQVGQELTSVMAFDTILQKAAQLIKERFEFQLVSIFILDKYPDEGLILKAMVGASPDFVLEEFRLEMGKGIIGWAAQHKEYVLANNVHADRRFYNPFPNLIVGAELSLPLLVEGELVGVLDVQSEQRNAFDENNVLVLNILASELAVAIRNAQLYDELDAYSGFLEMAIHRRTNELRQIKERVEAILNHSPDSILMLSSKGIIETGNPAFYQLFRFTEPDVRGFIPADLVTPEYQKALEGAIQRARNQMTTSRIEAVGKRQDLTTFDADIALAPINENQELIGIVCNIRDVSSLKELERMKDALLATAAHELRTPLTSIQGFSELLLSRELPPDRHNRYLNMINNQSKQLGSIIDDLLDVAKLEAGRGLYIKPEPIHIGQIIHNEIRAFEAIAPDYEFKLDLPDSVPPVQGDPFRLAQVVRNLITNAIKFSNSGTMIRVGYELHEKTLQISVTDEGIGVTPEQKGQIFEKFYRVDMTNTAVRGTGLGLTICQLIVEGHGGKIWVDSVYGQGSTFSFTIPLAKAVPAPAQNPSAPQPS